ncbi:MAG: TetR/AcrR family transcriptional regulator [Xenococcaceae cyanobacterium MO_188.B32]|nr:TetR/AcrR family transcriptional regulator [Xenococcaceae cyanobacterium MO_188.B32]
MSLTLSPRARVIQAALNLFYAEGFHSVGTNRICSEAKVNKSTLYHLFPSKIDMVLAALEVYASDITRKFKEIAKSKIPAEQKLEQLFETPFRANQALKQQLGDVKGCFVGNIALELAGKEERVRTYLTYVFQTWAESIEPIVKELAINQRVDTQKVSRSMIAYLQGAILMSKAHNDPQFIKDFAKSASALVL